MFVVQKRDSRFAKWHNVGAPHHTLEEARDYAQNLQRLVLLDFRIAEMHTKVRYKAVKYGKRYD